MSQSQKPEIIFESGKLTVKGGYSADFDADGKPSATISAVVEIDAAEVVSEIAKKDLPWLEALLSQLKA